MSLNIATIDSVTHLRRERVEIHVVGELETLQRNVQHASPANDGRQWDVDALLEAPTQCLVDLPREVGSTQHDDLRANAQQPAARCEGWRFTYLPLLASEEAATPSICTRISDLTRRLASCSVTKRQLWSRK